MGVFPRYRGSIHCVLKNEDLTEETLKYTMSALCSKPEFLCKHFEWLMDVKSKNYSDRMDRFDFHVGLTEKGRNHLIMREFSSARAVLYYARLQCKCF